MPDFERPIRSLEHHAAATPEQKAYVAGKQAGEDKSRKQVVILATGVALLIIAYQALTLAM
jgi:hypothetical protein